MKYRRVMSFPHLVLFLALGSVASASTTWYVNGVSGSDNNNCLSSATPCQTIGHAISLAASGDSIMVAGGTYIENLTIGISLSIVGYGASTTIMDGGRHGRVVTIGGGIQVTLSRLTIRNGYVSESWKGCCKSEFGGGIYNNGTLTVNNSTVSGNTVSASVTCPPVGSCGGGVSGGGIYSSGTLVINNTSVSGNVVAINGCSFKQACGGYGGGISNLGGLRINNSTISGNGATGRSFNFGGGIYHNVGTLTVINSTINGNTASWDGFGGGIYNDGATVTVSSTTLSGNSASFGGNIRGNVTIQNSIIANSGFGGNCSGTVTSDGYNLSSDSSCNFSNVGDLNNTDPRLGTLGSYGGPTQTIPLLSGSPAIDAGNPNGCTDGSGNLLKTDQRGMPRPDKEDSVGCDIGAYENQSD